MRADGTTFVTGWTTDKGCVRQENEDAFLVAPHLGLWAVADGMGGHEDGSIASQALVAELKTIAPPLSAMDLREACEAAVFAANARLQALSSTRGGVIIGSTLVVLLIFENSYACIWSGDSRIYLVRAGAISPLTRDHTELEDLLAQGVLSAEEAQRWPRRNVITRAIGVASEPELEMTSGTLVLGDTFILCSDGLTSHVTSAEIQAIVGAATPQDACDRLLQKTLERGASDNVTIVVARHEMKATTLVQPGRSPMTLLE